jgi:hypothetical protein
MIERARAGSSRPVHILGLASLVWGAFLFIGMGAGILLTYATWGDADPPITVADWTLAVALMAVGIGLLRDAKWALRASVVLGIATLGFGVYWRVWGNSATGPGFPTPDALTGAGLPWFIFLFTGAMILASLGVGAIRDSGHRHKAPEAS